MLQFPWNDEIWELYNFNLALTSKTENCHLFQEIIKGILILICFV